MKSLFATLMLITILLGTGLAQGQSADMMGLYFDEEGLINCIPPFDTYQTYDLYLILKNATEPYLYGYECGMTIEGPSILLGTEFYGQALNVGVESNYIVGLGEPLPTAGVTPLIHFTFMYSGFFLESVCFRLHGSNPSSLDPEYPTLLYGDSNLVSASIDEGLWPGCSALIGTCGLPTTTQSFDSLKSLYR